jgi:hypothetical protein
VVFGAASAQVKLSNGDVYDEVGIVDTDERKDIALLKIKAVSLPVLQLKNSDEVEIGSSVYALGSPLGLEGSISHGLVSALRPGSEVSPRMEGFRVIQFTAPMSPGSSGGPLLDETGKVVGLVSASAAAGQNLNLAIPANYIRGLAESAGEAKPLAKMSVKPSTNRSPEEALVAAKTLCVSVRSGGAVLKTETDQRLLKWGKLRLVSSPNDADLVLEIVPTGELNLGTGAGNQAAALLRDSLTSQELWSTTKGGSWAMSGWSNAWVARAIAGEFIKFYESKVKSNKK